MSIPYQGAATAETHTMCSRQHAIKEPLQLIVFRKQWPPIYHPSQQLQHLILTIPEPPACTSQVLGNECHFKRQYPVSDMTTQRPFCVYQANARSCISFKTHIYIYLLHNTKTANEHLPRSHVACIETDRALKCVGGRIYTAVHTIGAWQQQMTACQ